MAKTQLPDTAGAAPASPKKGKLPLIAAAVVVAVLCLGALGAKAMAGKGHGSKAAVLKVGETMPLDEFLLNLSDPSNDHYVKTTIALGLKEGLSAEKFKDKTAQSRDAIVMTLSSKSLEDLRTSDGKVALKKQIKDAVNKAVGEDDVAEVYFEAFATQ